MADQDVFYHELLEAMAAGGCPMCRLARKASDSYLNALIYEGVVDVDVREKLRNARGLCYRHAWRIARRRGSVLGVSIIYSDVVNTLVKTLEAQADAPTRLFCTRPARPGPRVGCRGRMPGLRAGTRRQPASRQDLAQAFGLRRDPGRIRCRRAGCVCRTSS